MPADRGAHLSSFPGLRILCVLPFAGLLGACKAVVLAPAGDIAIQQRDILFQSVLLMLIVIVPVMALTVLFAWRYRSSNKEATYEPDWGHSVHLELIIWSAPLLIIICLGAITWASTHLLDPYRPLDRLDAGTPVADEHEPLVVNVVALDWKWLFIYPELGIGAVNELAAPVDRPIDFRISASSVMNSFYIPALAGQIYAMPGMRTQLHAVINEPGEYKGFSANYSGAGFSGMHFDFHGLSNADFEAWVAAAKSKGATLDGAAYLELERPSQNEPARTFASVEPGLFEAIVNMCVDPAKMCMNDMMAIDARGGMGLAGARNTLPVAADAKGGRKAVFGPRPTYVASICSTADPAGLATLPERSAPSALMLRDDIAGPSPSLSLLDRFAPTGASQS
ncbi:MAG: ubiquinol oxidase subunit II [Hyphomicrobiales bacterium]|nr:ubiquinol oxidase subunit II [Hyphomicrobiales bacterium]